MVCYGKIQAFRYQYQILANIQNIQLNKTKLQISGNNCKKMSEL